MICPKCQAPVDDDMNICLSCGAPIEINNENVPVDKDIVKNQTEQEKAPDKQANHSELLWKPLTLLQCILMVIVFIIPIINLIFLFVWSFKNNINPSKQNLSRAILIVMFIALIIAVVMGANLIPAIDSIIKNMTGNKII